MRLKNRFLGWIETPSYLRISGSGSTSGGPSKTGRGATGPTVAATTNSTNLLTPDKWSNKEELIGLAAAASAR